MRRYLVVLVATLALLLPMASPAGAVTNGVPDNGAHPYVGLSVFYDADWNPLWRCSGTMISEIVYLTAGHCTDGAAHAQVWFDEKVTRESGYPLANGYIGAVVPNPNFVGLVFPNTNDVGMVILNENPGVGWADVAPIGTLDAMATKRGRQETWFTAVGYGLQQVKPTVVADRVRLQATVQLVNLQNALIDGYNLQHSGAKGTGGGTCSGDSGGPVFLNGTSTIVAVTSFGLNANCAGVGFAYRVDTQAAYDFIFGS
jgi:secreted trypsin-like serine protease